MIKKINIYFILIFFSTNVVAQDLIMKCGENTYKYISDQVEIKFYTNIQMD